MVYPVYVYGNPILRKIAKEINEDYPNLAEFIENMFETMEKSDGIGLAAPQVGESIRLFVINGAPLADDDESLKDFRKVFINAKIVERYGDDKTYNEGCLSLPGIREDVVRKSTIRIRYYDEDFNLYDEIFDGIKARIIQHEYDHIEGKLLIDHLVPLKKRLLKRKLSDISKGIVEVSYKIKTVK
jgi:peptide deformylase